MTTTVNSWIQAGDGPQGDSYLGRMERPVRLKRFQDHHYLAEEIEWIKQEYYRRGLNAALRNLQMFVEKG